MIRILSKVSRPPVIRTPPPWSLVQVGLFDVRIEAIDTAGGSFSATFWLHVSWNDPRLAWNPDWFQGDVRKERGSVWEPYVYLRNMGSSKTSSFIGATPPMISK